MRLLLVPALLVTFAAPLQAAGRPMTVDDLLAVKGVADPQVSPDGKWVVYVVSELDRESGKTNSDLWILRPNGGGGDQRLTTAPGVDNHPRWSPDGKTIAFVSNRSGSPQIWLLPVDGGEARQLTKLPIDVAGPVWSPQGDKLAFAAEVYPGKSPEETAKKDREKEASKSKVRIFDHLMIRHGDHWNEGKRSHLFVCDAQSGEANDLTPKLEVNTPPGPLGGSNEYSFAPDGKEIAFTAEPLKDLAWSTNTDIWVVPVAGGEAKNFTEANKGADGQPAYSPDGRFLAYVSQRRAGFEADQWVLKVRKREPWDAPAVALSEFLDRPVLSFSWWKFGTPSLDIIASIDDAGSVALVKFTFSTVDVTATGKNLAVVPLNGLARRRVVSGGSNTSAQMVPGTDGLIFVRSDAAHPPEIYYDRWDGEDGDGPNRQTLHNSPVFTSIDCSKAEGFTFKGADGDPVSGWLVRPPGFDPKKKYPVVFLIHGGPQGAWHDEWHARWNLQMFAAPGYAVVALNPRGSTGYGQKFTDQISRDWTGKVYDDLMKGLDFALDKYPFLDKTKVAVAGGSYGGFMVNWIAGHTDRFQALISHAGAFDLTSKYGTTEELWFPEWEFGGTPWEQPEHYRERSPSTFVQNFKTPTLVIHGALDFRVPDAQGLGMFTSLQRRGVPSRYVFFPDEGHWILKPANRVVWWREMQNWLGTYLK